MYISCRVPSRGPSAAFIKAQFIPLNMHRGRSRDIFEERDNIASLLRAETGTKPISSRIFSRAIIPIDAARYLSRGHLEDFVLSAWRIYTHTTATGRIVDTCSIFPPSDLPHQLHPTTLRPAFAPLPPPPSLNPCSDTPTYPLVACYYSRCLRVRVSSGAQ